MTSAEIPVELTFAASTAGSGKSPSARQLKQQQRSRTVSPIGHAFATGRFSPLPFRRSQSGPVSISAVAESAAEETKCGACRLIASRRHKTLASMETRLRWMIQSSNKTAAAAALAMVTEMKSCGTGIFSLDEFQHLNDMAASTSAAKSAGLDDALQNLQSAPVPQCSVCQESKKNQEQKASTQEED